MVLLHTYVYFICIFPHYAGSPTGAVAIAKLKEDNRIAKLQIQHLEERLNSYIEANKDLKKDKEFLLNRLGAGDEAAIREKPGTIPLSVVIHAMTDFKGTEKSSA